VVAEGWREGRWKRARMEKEELKNKKSIGNGIGTRVGE